MGSEHARRMSTGNIQSRQHMEMTGSTPQLRRDLSSLSMSQVRRDSVNSQLRRDSVNSHRRDSVSSQIRRDSGGSSGTPSRRESLPASPFRQEFDPMAHLRRESDPATPSSRRGSVTSQQTAQLVAAHRNVDWSQSDEPAKPVKPSSNHVVQKKANGNTNINSITNTNTTTPTHTSTITSTNTNTNTNGKWSLKGRLGKGSRSLDQGRKEDPPQVEGVSNAPPSKSTRPSLLSRLKRQSA